MRKTARKNILRLIGSTKMFFITMIMVSALAVMAYTGVSFATESLINSCEKYFDDNEFYDFQLGCIYGFDEDKMNTILSNDEVWKAEASYYSQELIAIDGDTYVASFYTQAGDLNSAYIKQGRPPACSTECMVEQALLDRFDLKLGDEISLSDPSSMMQEKKFTIVGAADLVTVFSTNDFYNRGTSELGDGQVTTNIMVLEDVFSKDSVKRICYVTIKDRPERDSKEYKEKVESVKDTLIPRLLELDKEKFTDKKNSLSNEIEDGKDEIHSAETEISDASEKISDAQKKILESEQKLSEYQQELSDGEMTLKDAGEQLKDGKAKLQSAREELDTVKEKLSDAQSQLSDAKAQLTESRSQLDTTKTQLESYRIKLNKANKQLTEGKKKLDSTKSDLDKSRTKLDSLENQITAYQTQLDEVSLQLKDVSEKLNDPAYEEEYENLSAQSEKLIQQKTKIETTLTGMKSSLQEGEKNYQSGYAQYTEKLNEYEENKSAYDQQATKFQQNEASYSEGEAAYKTSEKKYLKKQKEYNKNYSDYLASEKEYNKKLKEISEKEKAYKDSSATLSEKSEQLQAGMDELESSKEKLKSKKSELDSQKEKLKDAQKQLEDAEDSLEMLPEGKVYSSDIFSNASYNYYTQTTEGTDTVVGVLSILFLAIAALVSYTTISRLVTEQHRLIGAQKAFGFRAVEIYSNYMLYASIAAVLGCVIGLVCSYIFMQRLIYYVCYRNAFILQDFTPMMNWLETGIICIFELFCMTFSAFLACNQMLKKDAIDLINSNIRSSFVGKERQYGFLPFSLRMTLRNLKSNPQILLTAVISVFGCTFLLITVLTVRNGMSGISNRQFNELQNYEGTLIINKEKGDDLDQLIDFIETNKSVQTLSVSEKMVSYQGKDKVDYASMICANEKEDVSSFFKLIDVNTGSEMKMPDTGVYICKKMAENNDLQIGDSLSITDTGGNEYNMEITGIFDRYIGMAIIISETYYNSLREEALEFNQYYVQGDQKEVAHFIEGARKYSSYGSWSDARYYESEMEFKVNCVNQAILIMIVIIWLLSVFVLSNLSSMNIKKKEKEIVTMKVLGFPKRRIYRYIFRESMAMCILGLIIGVLLGAILGPWIGKTIELETLQTIRDFNLPACVFGGLTNFIIFTITNLISLKGTDLIKMTGSSREA